MGWLPDYICRLLNSYPQYKIDDIMTKLPMLDGYILYTYSFFNDAIHKFSGIKMKNSYCAQEADMLLEQLKHIVNK